MAARRGTTWRPCAPRFRIAGRARPVADRGARLCLRAAVLSGVNSDVGSPTRSAGLPRLGPPYRDPRRSILPPQIDRSVGRRCLSRRTDVGRSTFWALRASAAIILRGSPARATAMRRRTAHFVCTRLRHDAVPSACPQLELRIVTRARYAAGRRSGSKRVGLGPAAAAGHPCDACPFYLRAEPARRMVRATTDAPRTQIRTGWTSAHPDASRTLDAIKHAARHRVPRTTGHPVGKILRS